MNKPMRFSRYLRGLLSLIIVATLHAAWADETGADTSSDTATVVAATAAAQPVSTSSIQLETTSVTGSRELPKVLVIVPWKNSEAIGPGGRPLASLVEEALTPLDPDVFRRQLSYYTELHSADAIRSKKEASSSSSK